MTIYYILGSLALLAVGFYMGYWIGHDKGRDVMLASIKEDQKKVDCPLLGCTGRPRLRVERFNH